MKPKLPLRIGGRANSSGKSILSFLSALRCPNKIGKGFSFVARQQRITIDGDHFYIDLVLYNRLLRCFVLWDLKLGRLRQFGASRPQSDAIVRE